VNSAAWPTDIRVRNEGTMLALTFDTAEQGEVSAELLRVESPSAEVKGHGPGQEQLVWGKRKVKISKVTPPAFSPGPTCSSCCARRTACSRLTK
jgi:DUF971 family protein